MREDLEVWRYIPDSLDYQVSTWGRVRRVGAPDTMKIGQHKGRPRVKLMIRTQPRYFYVHRLVAKTFMPGFRDDDGLEFLDGDRFNTHLDNLQIKDRETGRINLRLPPDIRVEVVETGDRFRSISAAARAVGGQGANVNRVLHGTLNHHKGFTYRLVNV